MEQNNNPKSKNIVLIFVLVTILGCIFMCIILPLIAFNQPSWPLIFVTLIVCGAEVIMLRRSGRSDLVKGGLVLFGTVLVILCTVSLFRGLTNKEPDITDIPREVLTLPIAKENKFYSSVSKASSSTDYVLNNCLSEKENSNTDSQTPIIITYSLEEPTRLTFFFEKIKTPRGLWTYIQANLSAEGALNNSYAADDTAKPKGWGSEISSEFNTASPFFEVLLPITDEQKYQEMNITAKITVMYPQREFLDSFTNETRRFGMQCTVFIVPEEDLPARAEYDSWKNINNMKIGGWILIGFGALLGGGLIIFGGIIMPRRQGESRHYKEENL